jgi:ABC-2 type transport system ATP-binding protein
MTVIEVTGLRKKYRDTVAVDGVSFAVEEGEIFGVLGPNGAGKTTTVECLAGLRAADSGTISVHGLDPCRDAAELKQILGIQLQSFMLPEKLKVWEALDLYASYYRDPVDWNTLLERVGVADKRDARFGKLSGGQKQRVSIALALVGNPRVAILDELTTGLDPQARRDTWGLIKEIRATGVTIILVTHFMEEAERLCDRLALIDSGRVVAIDSPAGLVGRVEGGQRVTFRPSAPLPESALSRLPEVLAVSRTGDEIMVTGTGDLLAAIITTLAEHRVQPLDLRMQHANLEDAFVALTGRKLEGADR